MEYFQHINSSNKKLYPSYDELPPCTKKVYSALLLMCTDASYKDEELEFMPTNRQIAEISGVNSGISHHLAVLDRNEYIWVTWTYKGRRKHRIELLNKEESKMNNSIMEV